MPERIHVLSPRTWGEFGNFLAATRFARAVRESVPDVEVTVIEVESLLPWIGDLGGEIREITVTSPDPQTRTRRYLELMDRIAGDYPAGFEADPGPVHVSAVAGLTEHLKREAPDLVVGTKGFVARLAAAAARAGGLDVPVASYVTNPGLLDLAIHRSAELDAFLVPFDWAKDRLLTAAGGAPERVHVVGPLVAQHDLGAFLTSGDDGPATPSWTAGEPGPAAAERPRIIVFSNRGGEDYARVVGFLARKHPDVDLVFVGYHDPEAVQRAASAISGSQVEDWRFHSRLSQPEYLDYITGASRARHSLLISKAGPNTTLEAVYFGIPVLMLASGLPMEDWVPGLIRDHGLGDCRGDVDELITVLDRWLDQPGLLREHKRAAQAYADAELDQQRVTQQIGAVIRTLLPSGRGRRTPAGSAPANRPVEGRRSPVAGADAPVLRHLREHRGGTMHVIDPFKVPVTEAVEKAIAVERHGMAAVLLASTDYADFHERMPAYVAAVKEVVSIPVLLHFPPEPGHGVPVALNADATVLPALLGSEQDYYVWKSLLETFSVVYRPDAERPAPEPLLSAALTFGQDQRSYQRMGTMALDGGARPNDFYTDVIRMLGFDMVYLYSRHSDVTPQTCRFFRERMRPEQLLFVSGGVRRREQVTTYLDAGADYVAFAGALERPDWRSVLDQLCPLQP